MKIPRSMLIFVSVLFLFSQYSVPTLAESTSETPIPQPLYHWGFEEEDVNGTLVSNQINQHDTREVAELQGDASVVQDDVKGDVLYLNGEGWLSLPSDLYKEVEDALTLSMWVNIDQSTGNYSRIFSSTVTEKYIHFQGVTGNWSDPEFSIAAGGGDYNHLIHSGSNPAGAADYRVAVSWTEQPLRNQWQHLAITMNSDGDYHVYLDGIEVPVAGIDDKASVGGATVIDGVQQFFDPDRLAALVHNDFGRPLYTSDDHAIGYFDDIQLFNVELTSEQISEVMGLEYDSSLKSVTVRGEAYKVNQRHILIETTQGRANLDEIEIEPTSPDAQIEIKSRDLMSYEIRVTSPNQLKQSTYILSFFDPTQGAVVSFDMTSTIGEMMHGASGFLYGVAEPNVPTVDLLSPLKPQSVEQKPPEGLQHPTGDALRVADTYDEAGIKYIQLAVPDMYVEWPYEYIGLDHYEGLVREVVKRTKAHHHNDKISYVIFNEPNGIWFNNGYLGTNGFLEAWEKIYHAVREEDPDALIAGPNLSHYDQNFHEDFIEFAVQNDVVPDQFTWHELSGNHSLLNWDHHFAHFRGLMEEYDLDLPIVINEYSNAEDPGAPGRLVRWLSRIENSKVYGSLAYWHAANSLNELAADANKPNGAWWLYKWYGDMTGKTVEVSTYNTEVDGLYGLASIDDERRKAYTVFGGDDGVITAILENITETETFKDATSAHVKLYRTKYTGFFGSHEKPIVEFEGNLPIVDGHLSIQVEDAFNLDAFHAIVSPATGDPIIGLQDYDKVWTKTYEAEDAMLNGAYVANQGWGVVSNGKFVRGLTSTDDHVSFNVTVPKDGRYLLEVFYGNEAPSTNGRNRAQGVLNKLLLKVDGQDHDILTNHSTVNINNFASEKLYVDLTEGSHTLKFSVQNGREAALDKIDLTYAGEIDQEVIKKYEYEAEEASYSNGFVLSQAKGNFSGAGYLQGSGETQFTIVVEDNGYYDLELGYASDANQKINLQKRIVNYPADANAASTLTTEWSQIASYDVKASSEIASVSGAKVYLTAGANTLKVVSEKEVSFDYLSLTYMSDLTSIKVIEIEAEDAELFGQAIVTENENASGGKIVTEIGESDQNGLTLKVNVEEAGAYKLSIDYINNEPAPVIYTDNHPNGYLHPYNTDLVERYAQIVVNGGTAQTVYFKNTLSWDTVKNHVVDIELNAGENKITIYNDNSYRFNNNIQYAPHFDKFEIAKSSLEIKDEYPGDEPPVDEDPDTEDPVGEDPDDEPPVDEDPDTEDPDDEPPSDDDRDTEDPDEKDPSDKTNDPDISDEDNDEKTLPITATTMFNALLLGVVLMLISFTILLVKSRNKKTDIK